MTNFGDMFPTYNDARQFAEDHLATTMKTAALLAGIDAATLLEAVSDELYFDGTVNMTVREGRTVVVACAKKLAHTVVVATLPESVRPLATMIGDDDVLAISGTGKVVVVPADYDPVLVTHVDEVHDAWVRVVDPELVPAAARPSLDQGATLTVADLSQLVEQCRGA